MKLIAKTVIAAALSALALSASAMTPIQDADLSQVTGQDGVSIAADLHINIGSFVYTDNATSTTSGGSVSFNNIGINGTVAATLDIIDNASFQADAFGSVLGITSPTAITDPAAAATQLTNVSAFAPTGDVVKIAIPNIAVNSANALNVTVGSITMGGTATPASFGSFAMNDIKLQGTTVYMWAH